MKKFVIITVAIFALHTVNAQSQLSYEMIKSKGATLLNRFFDSYVASNGTVFNVGDHILFGNPSMDCTYMHVRGDIQIADDPFSLIKPNGKADLNAFLNVKNSRKIKSFRKVASKTTFIKSIQVITSHRNQPVCVLYLDYTKKRKRELTFKSSGLLKFSGVGNNVCMIYPELALQANEITGTIKGKNN